MKFESDFTVDNILVIDNLMFFELPKGKIESQCSSNLAQKNGITIFLSSSFFFSPQFNLWVCVVEGSFTSNLEGSNFSGWGKKSAQ